MIYKIKILYFKDYYLGPVHIRRWHDITKHQYVKWEYTNGELYTGPVEAD